MVSFDWASKWGYLILPIICLFGFFTNLINIIVFLNPKMKDISFKYLLATSVSDLFYLFLLSYSFIVQCSDCPLHNTYFTQFYDFVIFHYINASLAIFCIFTDIVLSLLRYSILKNKYYFIQSLKHYKLIGFLFLLSFIYYSPLLFFKKIIQNNNNNNNSNSNQNNYSNNETLLISKDYIEYSEVNNSIGSSIYGQITPIILQSIRIILAMFVLTGINMLNVIEFRKRYSNRSETSQYITESIYIYI
jgi:hypothetical protein